ncbi:MAG: serine/threonine protein kinase [Deltaproteobacteria bacterium]|nr:serine/threonine protein kinase [Deltaproteobacteria bacterium]
MERPFLEVKQIDKAYQVLSLLGSGMSADVYQVQGPQGILALKMLKKEIPGWKESDGIKTFKFEFNLLKELSHPHIIKIFDFGFDPKLRRFYFTQELIPGRPLNEIAPSLNITKIQRLFLQSLKGLAYLHQRKVLHGDLKPTNLLVAHPQSLNPTIKMIDFGVSHPTWVEQGGTPSYMPPEKILKEAIDPRSDLYSLALVFYTTLARRHPFKEKNVLKTMQNQIKKIPPSLKSVQKQTPQLFSHLIALMLAKKPEDRPPSAQACLNFLGHQEKTAPALEQAYTLYRSQVHALSLSLGL